MFEVIEEKIAVPLMLVITALVLGGIFLQVREADDDFNAVNQAPPIVKSEKKDPTANWQTYRNEEFGFEFKYPEDMKISSEPSVYNNPEEEDTSKIFSLEIEGGDYRLDILMNVGRGLVCSANKYISYEVAVQNSGDLETTNMEEYYEDAERCGFEDSEQSILLSSGFIYEGQDWWIGLGGEASREKELKQVFNQTLSTFKFIE